MGFARVETLEDLRSLNEADILEGYLAAERGDPEPGENRGRAYWHGWCNRMRDYGLLPSDGISVNLVRLVKAEHDRVRPSPSRSAK